MRRRTIVLLLIPVVLIGFAVFAVTYSPYRPEGTPQPTFTATSPADPARTFLIDPNDSIMTYNAIAAFNIQIPGTFGVAGRTVKLVPEEGGYRVKIDAIIDGTRITAVDKFVKDSLTTTMELAKYPQAYFVADSTNVIALDKLPATIETSGTLDLHGVKRNIQVSFLINIINGKLTAKGTTKLDLLDYAIRVPTTVLNSVLDFGADIVANEQQP